MAVSKAYELASTIDFPRVTSLNLFHSGIELFDNFSINPESEILFSDYCITPLYPYRDNIKFTSKALLITYPRDGFERITDDWIEVDSLDFHPWENILAIHNSEAPLVPRDIQEPSLSEWINAIKDPVVDYPYANVREGNIAFIFIGKPRSSRTETHRYELKKLIELRKSEVVRVYPKPFDGHVEMKIDVFLEDIHEHNRPDVDRLATRITDAFEGIAYKSDKQIRNLQPRIIDVAQSFRKIECRTNPMDSFGLENMPPGSVFPLATGLKNYYVVRILYYD